MRSVFQFTSGVAVASLMRAQPGYYELAVMVIFLATFWRQLSSLAHRINLDWQVQQLKRRLAGGLHADGDAKIAHLLLVGRDRK